MSVIVEACLYSGRVNPRWELTSEQIQTLKGILFNKNYQQSISNRPPTKLGYTGFSIYSTIDNDNCSYQSLPSEIHVFAGIIDFNNNHHNHSRIPFADENGELENFLLETGQPHIDDNAKTIIIQKIQLLSNYKPEIPLLDSPPYNPGNWNNNPITREKNNCYNYACNIITDTFAQPGRASGNKYTKFDCKNVGDASRSDGLISTSSSEPITESLVALVIAPGVDFHWYRRDDDNKWSHKAGKTNVINTDDSGRIIDNPETCDRGIYTSFCGYIW